MADSTPSVGSSEGANEPTSEPQAAGEQQSASPDLSTHPRRYFGDDLSEEKIAGDVSPPGSSPHLHQR